MTKKLVALSAVVICALMVMVPSTQAQSESKPIQLSLFTPIQLFDEGVPISGLRFSLIYGRSSKVTGLDLGLVNHTTSGMSKGVQWGFVGINDADFMGWQNNWVNVTKGNFEGFQWGLVNYANHGSGFQFGFVNYCVTMNGLQIGLINVIKQGGQFPVFPIVNWSF